MGSSFSTVGLIGRRGNPLIVDSLVAVGQCLDRQHVDVVIEDHTAELLRGRLNGRQRPRATRAELGKRCDLIVVVGGDGSLLGVGRDLAHCAVPVIGVNRGGLGFLADIAPEQIEEQLSQVLDGEYSVEDHFLLDAKIVRDGKRLWHSPALNDVVVRLGGISRMMEFSVWVDDEFVYEQRSDGLIIASPTGSTAYSLSAGGPIMHPRLDAIVIVPMFPHTLTSRPLVVGGNSTIKVAARPDGPAPEVSCDSQQSIDLQANDEVIIAKYQHPLRLLYPPDHSFYESCRSKLDWGSRLGDPAAS